MFRSASQHLAIYSPSNTTISYTVSNALHRSTRTSKILFALGNVSRIILCLLVLTIDIVKLQSFVERWPIGFINFYDSAAGRLTIEIIKPLDWRLVATGSFLVLYFCLRKGYTEETLLVLRGLGVQTSTSSPTYLSTSTTRFIPTTQIQDIVIHEAFKGLEVRFYLAIIVEGATEVVVVFPQLLPRRQILEEVWRGARKCLYEGRG
ncbi:hypothetical protein GJ744_012459 [Endocarpon pusillum]|uniref:Phosphatidylinositol N-acetylglucosaminyltransferase subunit H conserved domain-containing protein n=1 Tax=Endocarpon pusillum TaxID=364733 RepID=A0A8H7AEE9_9EURO|nr:hypothetical protein GJ744_012459 [Endocarpon pusillum]